jgi:hydroxymethylbilane synthase
MKKLTIATRSSALALWQTHFIQSTLLKKDPSLTIELLTLSTQGDQIQDKPLSAIGGKGLFIKELEAAVLDGRADVAVHSMKDVPNDLAPGLCIAAIAERGDPRDALVSVHYDSLKALPTGARVGTCSVRRQAQLLHLRPDLKVESLRGNVDTRVRKIVAGEYDAVVMAAAGLKRLSLEAHIKEYFEFDTMLPSVSQGAIGIECREEDLDLIALLKQINHQATEQCIQQERAFTKTLGADCASPVGVHAILQNNRIHLQGLVANLDGQLVLRGEMTGETSEAVGEKLALQLLKQGARDLF